jgi:hypothetical protein
MEGNNKASWLDDDPEWQELRQRIDGGPIAPPKVKKPPKPTVDPKTVSKGPKKVELAINLTIPKVRLPKLPKLTRKQASIGAGLGVVVLCLFVGQLLIKDSSKGNKDVLGGSVQEPDFDTVLPDGKKDETSDNKLGYDPQRRVASFRDTLEGKVITVSQQPLPEAFKNNTDEEVKKLAKGFNANEVIQESNPKAYLGTDVSGAQTVIFHKKGLLVFILSPKQIDKDQWAAYITKLL